MTDEDLTAEESRALRALSEGPDAPAQLEDAVVARLAGRGLIQRRRAFRAAWALALAAAAGIALFAAGIVIGQRRASLPPASGPAAAGARYVLLLYDAPGEAALSDSEMAERVAEYRDWAIGLRERGGDITGEKLSSDSLDLGAAGAIPLSEPLGGYFVFSAKDRESALAIARSCPHLKHGGRAELRPIEET
jgi:hypothetical protein